MLPVRYTQWSSSARCYDYDCCAVQISAQNSWLQKSCVTGAAFVCARPLTSTRDLEKKLIEINGQLENHWSAMQHVKQHLMVMAQGGRNLTIDSVINYVEQLELRLEINLQNFQEEHFELHAKLSQLAQQFTDLTKSRGRDELTEKRNLRKIAEQLTNCERNERDNLAIWFFAINLAIEICLIALIAYMYNLLIKSNLTKWPRTAHIEFANVEPDQ